MRPFAPGVAAIHGLEERRLMTDLAIETAPHVGPASWRDARLSNAEVLHRRLLRLAFDVHDGPMQSLTAVGYGLRELQRKFDARSEAMGERDEVAVRIREMIAELAAAEVALRVLITTLEGSGDAAIDTVDVIAAAETKCFSRRCNAAAEVIVEPAFRPDTHSQAIAIQSVLREALTNIAKHADARNVLVRVQASETEILLEIRDDGRGFDPNAVTPGSIGLKSMSERIGLLGGDLRILSRPGGPSVVTARLRRWQRTPGY